MDKIIVFKDRKDAGKQLAQKLILAFEVCAKDSAHAFSKVADEIICVSTPSMLNAVGEWYEGFGQTTDDEALRLLGRIRVAL